MQNRMRYMQAFVAASLCTLTAPGVVLAQSQGQMNTSETTKQAAEPPVSSLERELAGGELFTQADRDLVERIRQRLESDPDIGDAAQDLRIMADAGEVTLRGTVKDQDEKFDIGDKVQDIRGVQEVHNRLRVAFKETTASTTDTATDAIRQGSDLSATDVSPGEQHSRWWPRDRRVGAGTSRVGDEQQTGSGEMAETDRTGTTGPSGTKSFAVSSGAANAITRVAKPAGDYAFTTVDRNLAARIRQTLNGDPSLPVSNENVHLKVVSGTVTLEGWAPSVQAKEAIGAKVQEMPGVHGINNQLQVTHSRSFAAQED